MKVTKHANGKTTLKLSQTDWIKIGEDNGWLPKARQESPSTPNPALREYAIHMYNHFSGNNPEPIDVSKAMNDRISGNNLKRRSLQKQYGSDYEAKLRPEHLKKLWDTYGKNPDAKQVVDTLSKHLHHAIGQS